MWIDVWEGALDLTPGHLPYKGAEGIFKSVGLKELVVNAFCCILLDIPGRDTFMRP